MDDIQVTSVESRLEPFWLIRVATRTTYDRKRAFTVPVSGPEVRQVTLLGQTVDVDGTKGEACLTLSGIEHCVDEGRAARHFDGLSGARKASAQWWNSTP